MKHGASLTAYKTSCILTYLVIFLENHEAMGFKYTLVLLALFVVVNPIECWSLRRAVRRIGKGIKKTVKKVGNAVKNVGKAVKKVACKVRYLVTF